MGAFAGATLDGCFLVGTKGYAFSSFPVHSAFSSLRREGATEKFTSSKEVIFQIVIT